MFYEISKFLLQNNYCLAEQIRASKDFLDYILPGPSTYHKNIGYTNHPYNNLSLKLYDYQKAIVSKCLDSGRGVTVLATAGGKTLTMASLLSNFFLFNKQFKCLLIVPDLGLVAQTYTDFKNYGVPFFVSKWTGSDHLDRSANVIIANLGILQSEKSDLSWTENIDVLVFDEIHKCLS